MSGVFDLAGPVGARDIAPTSVAFPMSKQGRHPDFQAFRGSMPCLHVPLIVTLIVTPRKASARRDIHSRRRRRRGCGNVEI
jgi:hypothetical protein